MIHVLKQGSSEVGILIEFHVRHYPALLRFQSTDILVYNQLEVPNRPRKQDHRENPRQSRAKDNHLYWPILIDGTSREVAGVLVVEETHFACR